MTPSGLPTCLKVTSSSYTVDSLAGTATANDSLIRYAGPIKIVLDPIEPYYFNPAGVFADAACTNPNVPATITVTSTDGKVSSCGSTTATYNRVGNAVVYRGNGDCSVTGNVSNFLGSGAAGPGTLHTFVGDLVPCLPVPGDDPVTCGAAQLQGTWTETA